MTNESYIDSGYDSQITVTRSQGNAQLNTRFMPTENIRFKNINFFVTPNLVQADGKDQIALELRVATHPDNTTVTPADICREVRGRVADINDRLFIANPKNFKQVTLKDEAADGMTLTLDYSKGDLPFESMKTLVQCMTDLAVNGRAPFPTLTQLSIEKNPDSLNTLTKTLVDFASLNRVYSFDQPEPGYAINSRAAAVSNFNIIDGGEKIGIGHLALENDINGAPKLTVQGPISPMLDDVRVDTASPHDVRDFCNQGKL